MMIENILIIFSGFIISWIIFVIMYRLIFNEWLKWVMNDVPKQ